MKCPRDQSLLNLRSIEGHSGYRCSGCYGGWLPAKYLQSLEYSGNFNYRVFTETVTQSVSHVTALTCPAQCGQLRAARVADISLAWCPTCQGSWFNFGAISKLHGKYARHDSTLGTELAVNAGFSVLSVVLGALFS